MLRIINIAEGTTVDGPGLRTSIYFAGCKHACPGCHNPASWAFDAGEDWSVERLMNVIRFNHFNVSLSGGDPLYQAADLLPLLKAVKAERLNVWCYTGFVYEDIKDLSPFKEILPYIDVLVDGPFLQKNKPDGQALRFRGSTNQRFICPATGEELFF